MKIIFMLFYLFLIASCASTEDKSFKNRFDSLTLKSLLQEGKTTQNEVLEKIGAPDLTSEDESHEEVWVFQQSKHQNSSNSLGAGIGSFLPGPLSYIGMWGGGSNDESSSKSLTLTLHFNKLKVLKKYSLLKSSL